MLGRRIFDSLTGNADFAGGKWPRLRCDVGSYATVALFLTAAIRREPTCSQVSLLIADTFRSVMMTNTDKYAKWLKTRVPYNVAVKSLKGVENTFLKEHWVTRPGACRNRGWKT